MTLTVVVGSSGSGTLYVGSIVLVVVATLILTAFRSFAYPGKTTFLNDTTKSHKCTYIRQYHNIRPYIAVSKIPNFDPTQLPFWDIYVQEGKADTIPVGGTMAGTFTPGLSGGQRKLLLFELIYQRTAAQRDLLLVLDEPFAGVTDDFVPWIIARLQLMNQRHNILLVTNDHVETLKNLADNTIVVSAVDRSKVQVNGWNDVDRDKVILALSVGDDYVYQGPFVADYKFFFDVEVWNNRGLFGVAVFTLFSFTLFLPTFWNSASDQAPLVFVATSWISFLCINPYLITLVDWRNFMSEEAEALLHSSKASNKAMKCVLTLVLFLLLSFMEFGCSNAVINGFDSIRFWMAMLLDSSSLTSPYLFFGLYTHLTFEAVQIFAFMPFLFMIFFSTTYSPGSGVGVLKELRYLFVRFYFYCMIPSIQDEMEECPAESVIMLYMVLSSFFFLALFVAFKVVKKIIKSGKNKQIVDYHNKMRDAEFHDLQVELYRESVLLKDISQREDCHSLLSATREIPFGESEVSNTTYE
jgi:ABC-type nitrate/sulfonate/bicarbonate transport system ATPase subunit